jgi:class I fructose-bisphosphate aldolase
MPVLVAGGPRQPDFDSFLAMVGQALECGVAGVNVGRNIFQHSKPLQALDRIVSLVHG